MTICPRCRTQLPDGSRFCIRCGFNMIETSQPAHNDHLTSETADLSKEVQEFVPGSFSGPSFKTNRKKKYNKKRKKTLKFIPFIIILLLAGFLGCRILLNTKKVIDLDKCVTVAFSGYNGDGTAIMTINTSTLDEQIRAAKGQDADKYDADYIASLINLDATVKKHAKADDEDEITDEEQSDNEENDIDHLRRGDVITVTIDYSELQQRVPDLEFSGKDTDVEVREGIKDYKIIDPFLHVVPEFSGTAPFGTAGIKELSDKIPPELINIDSIYSYEINKTENIDIGDTIVLTFTEFGKHQWKDLGLKPTRDEMTYTVTAADLPKYVTTIDEISEEDMNLMVDEAEDRIISYLVSKYSITKTDYQGAYLMVPKKENWDSYDTKSYLIFLFKSQKEDSEGTVSDVWLLICSSDLRKKAESDDASDIYSNSEDNQVFDIREFGSVYEYDSREELYNDAVLTSSAYQRDPEFISNRKGE